MLVLFSLRVFYTFTNNDMYKQQILDSSKLKLVADDNFKLDENGRKLTKQVENIVGKGAIAHYECSVFKRLVLHTRKTRGCFGKVYSLQDNKI